MSPHRASLAVIVLISAAASSARATYSIVAADQSTRQVGSAVTSCVGSMNLQTVYGAAPGYGGINAQAASNANGRDEGVTLLSQGTAPADIITAITAASFDRSAATRQYGVVDLQGRAAGFTGASDGIYAHDQQGTIATFVYSIQGNILTGQQVLDQAEAGFRGNGCDLADRLMLAIEAGAQNGQGDNRCTGSGIPSDSAFIEVDEDGAAAGSYLRLSVTNSKPSSPLVSLRTQFDGWRAAHPCSDTVDGGAGSGGGGAAGQSGSGGAAGPSSGGGESAGSGGSPGDAGEQPDAASNGSGCGCAVVGRSTATRSMFVLVGLGLATALRRRRLRG